VCEPFPVLALASLVSCNGGVDGPLGPWLWDAAVIALGMWTMAHASELAAVRLEDVHWAGNAVSITLCQSKTNHSGRGQEVFINTSSGDTCLVGILWQFLSWQEAGSRLLFHSCTGAAMMMVAITTLCWWAVAAVGCLEWVLLHSLWISGATAAVEGSMTVEHGDDHWWMVQQCCTLLYLCEVDCQCGRVSLDGHVMPCAVVLPDFVGSWCSRLLMDCFSCLSPWTHHGCVSDMSLCAEWEYLGPAGYCKLERRVPAKKAKWYLHNLLESETRANCANTMSPWLA
jgi:hypothetical protein